MVSSSHKRNLAEIVLDVQSLRSQKNQPMFFCEKSIFSWRDAILNTKKMHILSKRVLWVCMNTLGTQKETQALGTHSCTKE